MVVLDLRKKVLNPLNVCCLAVNCWYMQTMNYTDAILVPLGGNGG